MEGVGARLGRSSTRYVPATVFTGPVRKWKKKWVKAQPSNPNHKHHHAAAAANRAVNGTSTASRLLFYKWTPISYINNTGSNGSNIGNADSYASNREDASAAEEPLKKKFKYIPIEVLDEQKNESLEQIEDDANPIETGTSTLEATSNSNGRDENPDINDATIDESQANTSSFRSEDESHIYMNKHELICQAPEYNPVEKSDLNEHTLDLSLGLKDHEEENETDTKADQFKDD